MIAIPNIEKPKGCLDCPVNDMACELWTEVANIKVHKHKDCTLIEITTCGECKWGNKDNEGTLWCEHAIGGIMKSTDFCSYGERKGE